MPFNAPKHSLKRPLKSLKRPLLEVVRKNSLKCHQKFLKTPLKRPSFEVVETNAPKKALKCPLLEVVDKNALKKP